MSDAPTLGGRAAEPVGDDPPSIDDFGVVRHRGSWLAVSPTQEAIMRYLIERFGEPASRTQVAAAIWPEGGPDPHAIDVHIHRLRPRLKKLGLVIHTLRGRGYLLEAMA